MVTIRDLLNRARWRDAGLHALEIRVVHRGAPGDERTIEGARIATVRSAGIELTPETEEADAVFVPYHRFLSIVGPDGVIWTKEAGVASPSVRESEPALEAASVSAVEIPSTLNVILREASAESPLTIDGSVGEGGGQLLRSSLTLAMATGTPFVLEKIRAGRKKPGLMRQHLTCVKVAAELCGAKVEGAELGSRRIAFHPGPIAAGKHTFDIGSAGSVSLVLQTIALPLSMADSPAKITVRGGTHALWAPPFPFLADAWLPLVRRAGADIQLALESHGFYPAGGGEVVLTTQPSAKLAPLHLGPSSGVFGKMRLTAIVSNLTEGIARRELAAAAELLKDTQVELASETVKSPGPGNAMWLLARDESTGVVNVFSGIGDPDTRAEAVGQAVAKAYIAWRDSGASVEEYLADQLMLPLALSGAGSYTTNELSLHSRTNLEVIRAFTGLRIRAWDEGNGRFRIAL